MKEIEKLPLRDFTKYCMSIAQVPSSYLSGLTIEEQLLWLCSFLTKEVIPTVNNNAEAVEELQSLYVLLKDYVDNYFDNLDIQEEVNAKLEEMAQSGELAELIAQYLEAQAIIGFNTCASLGAAENLANGSFAKTYGQNTYNDGKGAFYKIRTRINADVPDGYNIIELTNTENLVAEKMQYSGYDLHSAIETTNTNLSNLSGNVLTDMVVIGDSYTAGAAGVTSTWAEQVAQQLHLTLHKSAAGGYGYAHQENGRTFLNLLNDGYSATFADKVKYVISYGGINDYDQSRANVESAVGTFISRVKELYPNAQILIVGPQASAADVQTNKQTLIRTGIERACLGNAVCYVNAEYWLIDSLYQYTDTYASDYLHPSTLGNAIIASKMLGVINNTPNDNTKIALQFISGDHGDIVTSNNENCTHFNIKLTNKYVGKDEFTTLATLTAPSNYSNKVQVEGFVNKQEYYPVYKLDANNNVSDYIGCCKIGYTGSLEAYQLKLVSKVTTFTGNIVVSGDIYLKNIKLSQA